MDLKSPYDVLRDLFPQVDVRIIRATVLEHGDDLTSAIEFIVEEVLVSSGGESGDTPKEDLKCPISEAATGGESSPEADLQQDLFLEQRTLREICSDNIPFKANSLPVSTSLMSAESPKLSSSIASVLDNPISSSYDNEATGNMEKAWCLTGPSAPDNSAAMNPLICAEPYSNMTMGGNSLSEDTPELSSLGEKFMVASSLSEEMKVVNLDFSLSSGSRPCMNEPPWLIEFKGHQGGPSGDQSSGIQEAEDEDCGEISEHDTRFLLGCIGDEIMTTDQSLSEIEEEKSSNLKGSCVASNVFDSESSNDPVQKAEDLSISNTCAVDSETLDDYVQQLKVEKQHLNTVIEEIRSLHRNAEISEASAEKSKQEAERGGEVIIAEVNEMKHMLARAREGNAVHAGEVYGEKAVLATEARELLARLEQIRAEKATAIDTLNNIRETLHTRIEAAKQQIKVAEEELLLKETMARSAMAEEEEAMAKLSQESRKLEIEEELCRKFREFLINRGSMVDSLQAEMALLCEDVEALNMQVFSGSPANSFQVDLESSTCKPGNWVIEGTQVSFSSSNLLHGSNLMHLSEQAQEGLKESRTIYDQGKSDSNHSCRSALDLSFSAESLSVQAEGSDYGRIDFPSPMFGRFPPKDDIITASDFTSFEYADRQMEMNSYKTWSNKDDTPTHFDAFEPEDDGARSCRENSPEEDGWNLVFRS